MSDVVLVVEDDALVREALGQTLELEGYTPILASSFIVAKDHISADFEGVILSDIRMPGRDGLYLLDYVQSVDTELPVILLTGEGDIPMAVGAINKGAFDFLEKPCANDVLLEALRKALKTRHLVLENRRLRSEITRGDLAARLIFGVSDKAEALRNRVRKIAAVDGAVLIDGAPGTGIAKIADVVHQLSTRAQEPITRLPGAGLTPSQLETALSDNPSGTLFLDEFSAMPGESQFSLLEHIDAGNGARILAGSTSDLVSEVGAGTVNPDLFYHLEALKISIPALKDRPEDIPVIFRDYVRQASEQANVREPEITPDVLAGIMARDWPGNTRALMNEATRFVLGLDGQSQGENLGLVEKMAQVERTLIIDALQKNQGNASATATQLKLPRKTFYDKLTKHRIKPEDFR